MEHFKLLNAKPTNSLEKIKESYHKKIIENRKDREKVSLYKESYEAIVTFLNTGYFYGRFTHKEVVEGVFCRCGSKIEGEEEIIECDSCSCYIFVM